MCTRILNVSAVMAACARSFGALQGLMIYLVRID